MPRNFEEVDELTSDQRRQEIARILAAGFLGLRRRAALAREPAASPEKPAELRNSGRIALSFPAK